MSWKMWILLASFAVLVVAISGSFASASPPGAGHLVIKTLEVNKVDNSIDVAPPGPSVGDEDVIRADLVDPVTNAPLGFTQDFCVQVSVDQFALECYGTMHLANGVVNIAGSFFDSPDNTWGVTGGTGAFETVRGYMTLPFAPNGNLYHNLFLVRR
jgi:hypothetical protein